MAFRHLLLRMTALRILFGILEALFLVGLLGSVVVIVITTVEDLGVLFERDEPALGITASVPESKDGEAATVR